MKSSFLLLIAVLCLTIDSQLNAQDFKVQLATVNYKATLVDQSKCLNMVKVQAILSFQGSGTLCYYWIKSDGTKSSNINVNLQTGSSSQKIIEDNWSNDVAGAYTGWEAIVITSPVNITSSHVNIVITCPSQTPPSNYKPISLPGGKKPHN